MAKLVDPEAMHLASKAARVCMQYPFAVWHFGDSVYMDALVELSDATDQREFLAFGYGLAKAWAAHTTFQMADHTAPGAAIVELWRRTGNVQLIGAATRLAELWETFPRAATAEAFLHSPHRHQNVPIDCAHFDGPFFAKLAAATGEQRYAERAVYELSWRLALLQYEDSGLCDHSYLTGPGRHGGVLWGRGQGWALLGLADTLRALPPDVPGWDMLLERLRRLVRAMIAHQHSSGHWHTVVDDEDSYLESSVAAFFVAAVAPAVGAGLLDGAEVSGPLHAAWEATRAATGPDGVLGGVSAETPTTLPAADYRHVAVGGLYPWGQGPLILAAVAQSRWDL